MDTEAGDMEPAAMMSPQTACVPWMCVNEELRV